MANPAPTINQINAFNATQGTTIDFNIIGGTELIRSNRIYIYDLSDNSLICTHLYVSTESIHELPPNTDGSIVYESGKSSADFVNGAQYYAQIQTYTDTNGTQGGSGLSVAKMFWCLVDPTLTITTIPSTISTTSYNISATYTDTSASVVSNIIQQYQFNLYSATGSLLQSSGVVVGSGTQQGTSDVYDISHNFTGLNVGSSYYVTVNVTTTQGMSVTTQSNTFTVSIDTPTLGEATVVNNACDGYISVTSNLSGEYGGSGSGEIVSFETDSENVFSKLQVELEPVQNLNGYSYPWVGGAGKNKLDTSNMSTVEQSGVTFSRASDGTITVGGKADASVYRTIGSIQTENGVTYTLTGTPSGGTNSTYRITVIGYGYDYGNGYTFTGDGNSHAVAIDIYTGYPSSGTLTFKPMIRLASETDATYAPYENICPINGQDEASASVVGKNQLPPISVPSSLNGVTITKDGNGVININGTTTANTFFDVGNFSSVAPIAGTYIFSGSVGGSGTTWRINLYNGNTFVAQSGDGDSPTPVTLTASDTGIRATIYISSGVTLNNVKFYPMLRLASETDPTYEPYNAQTITQDFNATFTPTSTDTTPYLFKAVGDVYGDRLEDKIVGGTVAWNQLAIAPPASTLQNITFTRDTDKTTVTMNGTATAIVYKQFSESPKSIVGHVYLVDVSKALPSVQIYNDNGGVATGNGKRSTVGKAIAEKWFFIRIEKGTTIDNVSIKPNIIDLTQMFGSTIADYIYSLEQSQAGAGVAWFKKLFPNDYYAYNAGELLSVGGLQSHDTVGFNQWDEEWEVGAINGSGVPFSSNEWIRSKNFNRVIAGASYCIRKGSGDYTRLYFYDVNGNHLGNFETPDATRVVTAPSNAYYIKVSSHIATYKNDICINFSNPSRNGEYEPYEKHSYPLDSSLTLRGIPKLDASNNLYYDGDEYTSDGKVMRKYGIVDLGTLTWEYNSTYAVFTANVNAYTSFPTPGPNNMGMCSKYLVHRSVVASELANYDDTIFICPYNWSSKKHLVVRDTSYTDATTFKSAMSGVMLVYELATPTTETAEPYTNPQIVSKYGTLEYVTNSIVPVGHKTTYLTRDIFGGYVDLISGTLVVDKAMVDLGSLSWTYNTEYVIPFFYTALSNINGKPNNTNMMSSIYTPKQGFWNIAGSDMCVASSNTYLNISNSTYTDATTFKSAMNGVQLVYELATPQTYQLTPQQVNTLVGTNNVWSEQGNIELSYHIPITNLLVKRQDVDDVSGGWLTLYSQPITQASDMDFTFIDFLNQYGKTYKYALVPLLTQTQSGVEVEVEGGYTVSDEVQSIFDGVFIADSTGSQKCKANVGYGNVDMNQVVGSITPIGAKYPIIITNSHNQYHNGSISGTIVPDDYYFNGNLSRIDMVKKRNELEQFLTNKRVKVIKDWNGNIWLVMIVGNVSCTFNNNYGMGIVDFSTNWTEVGDPTNQQDLQATGLINVGGV